MNRLLRITVLVDYGLHAVVVRRLVLAVVATLACTRPAAAQHGDILLSTGPNGQLSTVGEAFVFSSEFGPLGAAPGDELTYYATTNPGFASAPESVRPPGHSALPANRALSFTIRSFSADAVHRANLWYWNGLDSDGDGDWLDDVSFAPMSSGAGFRVFRGLPWNPSSSSGVAYGEDRSLAGFTIDQTSSTGGLHVHPTYDVFRESPGDPEPGIYLASMTLQMAGLGDSRPLYFLFDAGGLGPSARGAASSWAQSVFAAPEPSSAAFVVVASMALVVSSPRRKPRPGGQTVANHSMFQATTV